MAPSACEDWRTPDWLFAQVDAEFGFTLDACATAESAKCARYYTVADDGLSQPWEGVVWCNPPYGRGQLAKWVKKGCESARAGAVVVMLVPCWCDTRWWHQFVMAGAELRFISSRVEFHGPGDWVCHQWSGNVVVVFRRGACGVVVGRTYVRGG